MTDLEITKLCAEAIGWEIFEENGSLWEKSGLVIYDPLHDDAQAMALLKKLNLCILPARVTVVVGQYSEARNMDLNRAICECVAKMQQASK